ncbi:MAG: hypothetical protein JWQ73_583 [Variovorax sp.]|nr:hypothetical protein [Variovorax sp.]
MTHNAPEPLPLGELPPKPTVSVAITSYNYGRYLAECIESCLAQTVAADEIVVVDDGSTDNSWDVASSYMRRYPRQVKAILNENQGMCSAANAVIAACSGDVVLMIDSDDIMAPERIEKVLAALRMRVDGRVPGWVHHPLKRFSATQPDLGLIPYYAPDALPHGYLADRVRQIVQCPVVTPMSGLAFRRELLRDIGPLDDDRGMQQDMQLSLAGALFSPVAFIDEGLTRYRIHPESSSAGGLMASLPNVRILRRRYERLEPWIAGLFAKYRPQAAAPWEAPLKDQPSYQWLQFLDKWWSGSGKDMGLLSRVLRHPQTRAAPLQQRMYYYAAICLPKSWYLSFSRMVYGSSPIKAFVRRRLGRA